MSITLSQRFNIKTNTRAFVGVAVPVYVTSPDMVALLSSETAIDCYIGVGSPTTRTQVKVGNWDSGDLLDNFIFAWVWVPGRLADKDLICEIRVGEVPEPLVLEAFSTPISFDTGDECGPTGPADGAYIVSTVNSAGTRLDVDGEWVHGHCTRVPVDSWMRDNGEDANPVTHVAVSTPYPGGNSNYENPYLLYSTDDGDSWRIWPKFFVENGSSDYYNPIIGDPDPGSSSLFNSDCTLAIMPDGNLLVMWRSATVELDRVVISPAVSSPTLANCTVGSVTQPTLDESYLDLTPLHPAPTGRNFITPTIAYENDILYLFFIMWEENEIPTGRIGVKMRSTDGGVTFTDPVKIFDYGPGKPFFENVWHIGISPEKINGYWWMLASPSIGLNVDWDGDDQNEFRLIRSPSLANWETTSEVDHSFFLDRDGGTATVPFVYQGHLFLASDGETVRVYAHTNDGTDWQQYVADANITARTLTDAEWWGLGLVTAVLTAPAPLLFVDAEFGPETIADLGRDAVAVTPQGTPDDLGRGLNGGVRCAEAGESYVTGATVANKHEGLWIEIDITIPEDYAGAAAPLLMDRSATGGSADFGRNAVPLRIVMRPNFDVTLRGNTDANAHQLVIADFDDETPRRLLLTMTHEATLQMTSSGQDITTLWSEGSFIASDGTPSPINTVASAGNNRISFGGSNPTLSIWDNADVVIHAVRVFSSGSSTVGAMMNGRGHNITGAGYGTGVPVVRTLAFPFVRGGSGSRSTRSLSRPVSSK